MAIIRFRISVCCIFLISVQNTIASTFESQCNALTYNSIFMDDMCLVKEGPGKQIDAKNGCQQLGQGKLMTQNFPAKIQTIINTLGQSDDQVTSKIVYPLSPNMAIGDSLVIKAKVPTSGNAEIYISTPNHDSIDYTAIFRIGNEFISNDRDNTTFGTEIAKPQPLTAGNTYTFEIRADRESYDLYIDGQRFHQHPYRFTQGTHAEILTLYSFDDIYSIARGKITTTFTQPLPTTFIQGNGTKLVLKGRTNEDIAGKTMVFNIRRYDIDMLTLYTRWYFDEGNVNLNDLDANGNWGTQVDTVVNHTITTANQDFTLEFHAVSDRYDIYLDGNLLYQWTIRVTSHLPTYLAEEGPFTITQTSVIEHYTPYSQCLRVGLEASKRTSGGSATDGWVWNSKLLKDQSWDAKELDWDTDAGEPNNLSGEELCACYDILTGKLYDISCDTQTPYICAYYDPWKQTKYMNINGKKGVNSTSVINYGQDGRNWIECVMQCSENEICKAVSYGKQQKQCITHYNTSNEMIIENNADFDMYDRI